MLNAKAQLIFKKKSHNAHKVVENVVKILIKNMLKLKRTVTACNLYQVCSCCDKTKWQNYQ